MISKAFAAAFAACLAYVLPAAASTACNWSIPFTPNGTHNPNTLTSISADSASDAWAAGYHIDEVLDNDPLVLHWNGSRWSVVMHSPKYPVQPPVFLYGIDALSPANVWIVGTSKGGATLIMHWDGSAWSNSPSSGPSGAASVLASISSVTASDIWSVGSAAGSGTISTLTEHWNGTAWSMVSAPNPQQVSAFNAVWSSTHGDAWAVGYDVDPSTGKKRALIENWNGRRWNVVPSPDATTTDNILSSVSGSSANDVWAVGIYDAGGIWATLAEHWDGNAWSVVSTPDPGAGGDELFGVADARAHDVWAVGQSSNGADLLTLAMHWDGVSWTVDQTPNKRGNSSWLNGVTIVPGTGKPSAIGDYLLSSISRTLNAVCR